MYDIISDVRSIVAKYGYKDVYTTLELCMKEDYEFLRGHFTKDVPYYGINVRGEVLQSPGTCESSVYAYKVTDSVDTATFGCQIPMVTSYEEGGDGEGVGEYVQTDIASYFQGTIAEEVIPANPDPTTIKNLVVEAPVRKVIKKVSAESVLPTVKVEPVVAVASPSPDVIDIAVEADVSEDKESVVSEKKEGGKYRDPKEMKVWQKKEEDKKRAELQEAGINGYDLMTVENMKQWVEVDGKTYSAVAREYLGIPDNQVSAFGKKHGIQSSVSKRRNMTILAKMRK